MPKVKILGIAGSPRAEGNTEYMLGKALEAASKVDSKDVEIELFSTAGKFYLPCMSCFKCVELRHCKRGEEPGDDFFELRDKWLDADGIILAVPVYHMSIPGNIKNFLDRLGCSLYSYYQGVMPKFLKVYGCLTQGIHIFAGQENTIMAMVNHGLLMGNVVVSGDFWEAYIGAAGWTENDPTVSLDALKRFYEDEHPDAVAAIRSAQTLGKRVTEVALMVKAGALQYEEYLKKDAAYSDFVQRLHKR